MTDQSHIDSPADQANRLHLVCNRHCVQWLKEPHKSRSSGPTYIPDRPAAYLADLIAPKYYDAI